tara:strand:- start:345 stop:551 length:207 start_codon:yes stop_codon:yes gene_type:complete
MDIKTTTEGFNGTTVTFTALTKKGETALYEMGGGFAVVAMTIRKSVAGDFQMDLEHAHGCKVNGSFEA